MKMILISLFAPFGVVAVIAGSAILAWLFILFAPILFVACLMMFFTGRLRLPRAKQAKARAPKEAEGNLEILCIKGMRTEQELLQRFRTGLADLWAQAPDEHAVVCSCVRKQRDSYYGILRMRTQDGHSYARVAGRSIGEVGERYLEQLDVYQREFPVAMTKTPVENPECNRELCHLKEHSIFHNGSNLVA